MVALAGCLGAGVATPKSPRVLENMMATLFVTFVSIFPIELFSRRLRARLRSDEQKRSVRELFLGFPNRIADSLLR